MAREEYFSPFIDLVDNSNSMDKLTKMINKIPKKTKEGGSLRRTESIVNLFVLLSFIVSFFYCIYSNLIFLNK